MSYTTIINTVISFLLISLVHYLYVLFSRRAVLSMTNNIQKKTINKDILDVITNLENDNKDTPIVEDTIILEDAHINMENELGVFLKNIT